MMEWRGIVIVFVFTCCYGTGSAAKSCSKLISKIPVHKDFDMDKFVGTWYTVSRTTWVWGANTYESSSMVLARNADDSLSYSLTGQSGDRCVAVETGVLEPSKRPGDFTMKGPLTPDPRMIISFTNYDDVALVYFCFKSRGKKNSVCTNDGGQVEVLSRSESPDKRKVTEYLRRAKQRLCATSKDMHATTPGLCKVPEILEAARKETIKGDDSAGKPVSSSSCVVDDIPVQQDIDTSMTNGVWYEIARTRYTFNKMESVVSNMYYDEESGLIHSFYTGTMASTGELSDPCVTPLQGLSRPKDPKGQAANRLGKIGGTDSAYPWAPMKIMYIDENYVMFYACYTGQTDEPCEQQGTEISILGKSRDLTNTVRDAMFALLPSACIDSNDVLDTIFDANCSSHVAGVSPKPEKTPSDCVLDDIPLYDDYSKNELRGVWNLYAYIHFNSSAFLPGVVMRTIVVEDQPVEPAQSTLLAFSGETTETGEQLCSRYQERHRERCLDTADRITITHVDATNFVFSKVMHLSDSLLVEYLCTKRTVDGNCQENGIVFNVFKRTGNYTTQNDTDDDDDNEGNHNDVVDDDVKELELISKLAKSACLDPNLLEYENEWCPPELLGDTPEMSGQDECDVDSLSIYSDVEEFNQKNIYGYWHLIARSNNSRDLDPLQSLVAYFISDTNDTLSIYYTGIYNDSLTADVSVAHLLARCNQESNGDYLIRYKETQDVVLYAPYKVLFLHTDTVLLTYTCQHVLPSGRCNESEAVVAMWSRNETLDDDIREEATEMMYWACVDPTLDGYIEDMPLIADDNSRAVLEEYITLHNIDDIVQTRASNEDDDYSDDDSDEEKQQKDQSPDDFSDIEDELLMSDLDFYGS